MLHNTASHHQIVKSTNGVMCPPDRLSIRPLGAERLLHAVVHCACFSDCYTAGHAYEPSAHFCRMAAKYSVLQRHISISNRIINMPVLIRQHNAWITRLQAITTVQVMGRFRLSVMLCCTFQSELTCGCQMCTIYWVFIIICLSEWGDAHCLRPFRVCMCLYQFSNKLHSH